VNLKLGETYFDINPRHIFLTYYKKLHKLTKIGIMIFIFGSGPLLSVMLFAKMGILNDPNPNPIIFGLMAMITFWPSLILIFIGIILQLSIKNNR